MQNSIIMPPYINVNPSDILKGVNSCINYNCPNAKKLMNISLTHPSKVKSNREYSVLTNDEVKNLRRNLNLPDSHTKRILVYSPDSELAKDLSHSKKIKQVVMDWKNGKFTDKNGNRKSKFVVAINDSTDMKRAINGCTITGLKEHSDGSVTGYIYDIYDFDSKFTDMKKGADLKFVNKIACYLQKLGLINNYQILVPIKIQLNSKS